MSRRKPTFKSTLAEINRTKHRFGHKKRITAGRVRKYLRVIERTEKKFGPHYLATDHTLKGKGFKASELNPIMHSTERAGYVRATRIGLKLTSRGKRAIAKRRRK